MRRISSYGSAPVVVVWAVFLVSSIAVFTYLYNSRNGSHASESSQLPEKRIVAPAPERLHATTRILFGGDVFWGRQFERFAPEQYNFPFSGLSTLDKGLYDAWIVNVECPITDEQVAFDLQWEAIQFNCSPKYLEEASKWFDVVSLANNHTDNVRGSEGLEETRANLELAGIQHFGNYEPSLLDDLCEVVSIEAVAIYSDKSSSSVQLPVAMCGYHGVFKTFKEAEIAHIERYAKHFITIAMPHAGAEYQPSSDEYRERVYRSMIDYGADAVIGNHPHWVQNTESYRGKLIVYSMGNFIFDQQFNDEVTRSALIDATITVPASDTLDAYIEIGAACREFKDACLEEAEKLGVQKANINIEYSVLPTRTTQFVTSYDPDGLESILERTQWQQTIKELKNWRQKE